MLKTVLIDNSLCAGALKEDAKAEDICGYLRALGKSGVKYAELDFRALMKLRELPEGIGYIFRAVDPMFMRVTEVFSFDYVLLTLADLKKNIKPNLPVMLELPFAENTYRGILRYAQALTDNMVSAVRFCDNFGYMEFEQVRNLVTRFKNTVLMPVDFCPKNNGAAALDVAVKLSIAGADSLTQSLSGAGRFSSLEEYAVSLLSVYDTVPRGFDFFEFFGAVYYYRRIFKNSDNADILKLFDRLAWDIRMMRNADTGEKTRFRITLKDSGFLSTGFRSAVERMLSADDIDHEEYEVLLEALKSFDASNFSSELLHKENKGLLN